MKELTLQEIQQFSLEILDDVHRFCEGHGIKYSLAYGSLIGAIRHKGFIPWDDDIDIFMPRPDYEKFCHSYTSGRFKILTEYHPASFINFTRVYDDRNTVVKTLLPFADGYKGGLWIDVFPMDGADADYAKYLAKMERMQRYWILQLRYRNASGPLINVFKAPTLKDFCILLTLKLFSCKKKKIKEVNDYLKKEAREFGFDETGRWTDYCVVNAKDNNYHLVEEFEETMVVPFEDRHYHILKGYDNVLRRRYGNYMELPPEEARVPKQIHTRFFWK